MREVQLPSGTIRYRERGAGPPMVFIHGLLVNGNLWRRVAPQLVSSGFRCLVPDWPLGSHQLPMPDADLTPPGVANLVAEFLEALDLRDVTIVANDTGGAITQLLMVQHPERIGRVVLTPCDSFERFLPPPFSLLPATSRLPGAIWLLVQLMRVRALHRLPMAFGWVSKRPLPPEIVESYLQPSRDDAAIRHDLTRFLRGVDNRYTLAAANQLRRFTRPVLLAWASEDRLFPMQLADRLQAALPRATLVTIDDSYTFVPEDQPAELARLIVDFSLAQAAA
jgi:pimeloyl-ACP methyl ester carboxylesterase